MTQTAIRETREETGYDIEIVGLVPIDDHPRVLRMLAKRHRDMARLRTIHCSRLHALLGEMVPGGVRSGGVKWSV